MSPFASACLRGHGAIAFDGIAVGTGESLSDVQNAAESALPKDRAKLPVPPAEPLRCTGGRHGDTV